VFELSALFDDLNDAAVHRMLTIWRATAAERHVVTRATSASVRPRANGDPGATHSESVALGPHIGGQKDAVLRTAMRGDEREGEHASSQNPSYAPVYWNDEKRSARETATRTPPRAAPAARPARSPSKWKA